MDNAIKWPPGTPVYKFNIFNSIIAGTLVFFLYTLHHLFNMLPATRPRYLLAFIALHLTTSSNGNRFSRNKHSVIA
ncbi:hypothetical protein BYT27DRAFT_7188625 [Phlegmacium glaucopus]|nr:hypothetical protein BYT27DRAFT_7188625 [Phlegmacium glaucopus]